MTGGGIMLLNAGMCPYSVAELRLGDRINRQVRY
jgi:hypothetical protein